MIQANPLLQVDAAAVRAEIGQDALLGLYRKMLLIRRFEEQAEKQSGFFREGTTIKKIAGFLHLYIGQEAVQTGFYAHLDPAKDATVTSYRCHALALLAGEPPKELMAELYGKGTGNVAGKGGSMHFFSKKNNVLGGHGIVGGQIPVGIGAAFSAKYRKSGGVSVSFLGDGASPQGTFHESLNMAALWKLPVVFAVVNNQYGMGTRVDRASACLRFVERAETFGVRGVQVDGMDVEAVYQASDELFAWSRAGNGPAFLIGDCYRYYGHGRKDPSPYRDKSEEESWRKKDPIDAQKRRLSEAGLCDEEAFAAITKEIGGEMDAAVAWASAGQLPVPEDLFTGVYAD